jgi:hypothetical protein
VSLSFDHGDVRRQELCRSIFGAVGQVSIGSGILTGRPGPDRAVLVYLAPRCGLIANPIPHGKRISPRPRIPASNRPPDHVVINPVLTVAVVFEKLNHTIVCLDYTPVKSMPGAPDADRTPNRESDPYTRNRSTPQPRLNVGDV